MKRYFYFPLSAVLVLIFVYFLVLPLISRNLSLAVEATSVGRWSTCPSYWLLPDGVRSVPFAFGLHVRFPKQFSPVQLPYNPYETFEILDFPATIPVLCPFLEDEEPHALLSPAADESPSFGEIPPVTANFTLFIELWRNDEAVQPGLGQVIVQCHLAWLSMCDDQCPDTRPFTDHRAWPVLVRTRLDPGAQCKRFVLDAHLFKLIPWEGKFDVFCSAWSAATNQVYGSPTHVLSFQTQCAPDKPGYRPPAVVPPSLPDLSTKFLATAMIVTWERPTMLDHAVRSLLTGQTYPAVEALILDDSHECADAQRQSSWLQLAQSLTATTTVAATGDRRQRRVRLVNYVCMNQVHRQRLAAGRPGIDGAVVVRAPPEGAASAASTATTGGAADVVYQWSIGAKRHYGVQLARGRFIVHWDDDDVYARPRLAYQVLPMMRGLAAMTVLTGRITLFLGQQVKEERDALIDDGNAGINGTDGDGGHVIAGEPGRLIAYQHEPCPPFVDVVDGPCQSVMYASLAFQKSVYDGNLVKYPFTSLAEDAGLARRILLRHADAWLPNRGYAVYVRHSSSAFDSDVVLGGVTRLDLGNVSESVLSRSDRLFLARVSSLPEITEIRRPLNAVCPFGRYKGRRAPFGIC